MARRTPNYRAPKNLTTEQIKIVENYRLGRLVVSLVGAVLLVLASILPIGAVVRAVEEQAEAERLNFGPATSILLAALLVVLVLGVIRIGWSTSELRRLRRVIDELEAQIDGG